MQNRKIRFTCLVAVTIAGCLSPVSALAAATPTVTVAAGGVTGYDKGIICFYFVFLIVIGLLFRRLSKNTSDYFRGGGAMPWWITGTSAWIAAFSAWTFVGAAAKVYETGTLVLWAYYPTVVAMGVVLIYTSVRFRRMRVITWMEGVRGRYGPETEQFYTWVKLPLTLLLSGVALNAIGVFMAVVFGLQMEYVLVLLGVVVTIVALVGGSFAVLASDFVQMFLVMTITIVTAILTLAQPRIGGLSGLVHQVPSAHPSLDRNSPPANCLGLDPFPNLVQVLRLQQYGERDHVSHGQK